MFCESAPCLPHSVSHLISPLALLYGSSPLSQDQRQKSVAGTLQKHRLHTCPTQTPQSASTCQHLHQAASALCQGLTLEQRATVPDVINLVICAQFLVS